MQILNRERNEIDNKYKWDLTLAYKNIDDWNNDFSLLKNKIDDFTEYKGVFTKSPKKLYAALKLDEEINRLFGKLFTYAVRKSDEDRRISENESIRKQIVSLSTDFNEKSSFFVPEIMKLNEGKIRQYMEEFDELKLYDFFFKDLFRFKKHTLSKKEEKILASASEVLNAPEEIFDKLNDADLKFGIIKDESGNEVELSKGNYSKYISSQDREIRKNAYYTFYESYRSHKATLSETLISNVKADYFLSKNRRYKSSLQAALFQNNIDIKVYDNVINTVHNNLDKMHKYMRMKKDILKLEDFNIYDFYVDLISEYDIEYKYEDALKIIFDALKPMGEKYINDAKKIFDNHYVDVFENVGKRSGAYSSGSYDTPPYILLNYGGKYHDVSTIIHELGHSMHTYYSNTNQPYIYSHYSIFLAEIASNVNEMILNMYMLDHAKDNKEKLYLINAFLENVKGSIYRQTMFAEFEKTIHEFEVNGEILTGDKLCDIYYELNKKYYGDDVIYDENIRYEWMRIPHFYYKFYVYQYATGLTAAFFIAKNIYEDKEGMRDKYIKFLSSGGSDYPLELLKIMDIDMTSSGAIDKILKYFDEQIDEFIKIYNKE
jgi:oligoendopeptidase F